MGGGGGAAGGFGAQDRTPQPQPTKPRKFPNPKKARQWFASIWPQRNEYAQHVRSEYRNYSTDTGYQTLNGALRAAEGDTSKFEDQAFLDSLRKHTGDPWPSYVKTSYIYNLPTRVQTMDEAFEFAPTLPEVTTLARGTRWHEFQSLGITGPDDDLHALLGQEYVNDSYTSGSVGPHAAMSDKPVQITITMPKGTRGVYMAGDEDYSGSLSMVPGENEFLLPRGTRFVIKKVTKVTNNDGVDWKVEVEVLLP